MALTQGLQLPFGIQPVNALLVDSYAGPYNSVAEALSSIPSALRVQTRFVNIIDSGVGKLYWFKNGIADGDLVEFSPAAGTVTSVGLSMPAAFSVSNSPVTSNGTLTVTGAGLVSQYVRGDGTLGNFPTQGGGGASVSYYLNGSINQGSFGGNTYYQMNKTPIIGSGTNFSISSNGYIAQFITNAGDPALLNIPAGNWNFELFFSSSSSGGNPNFYVELYKYNGTTFTLISSGSVSPESITGGTNKDVYSSSLAVPATSLTLIDRLAIRIYVNNDGRTITLHTEDNNLCEVITTFSTGLTALNSLTAQVQYLTTGTSGNDFNIASSSDTHTFNLPVASATNTGKLSATDWSTFNSKEPAIAAGTTLQYFRGDKTFQTLNTSVVPESGSLYFTNTRARSAVSLTTTGTSGVATYDSGTGVFNIPQYQAALTNPVTGTGIANQITYWTSSSEIGALSTSTYPSLTELSYVKGVTSAIQTQINSKLSGNQTITLSGDATGSGATSIAVTLANSGVTAGAYTKVTVDAKGRVTSGTSLASGDVTGALGYTPYNASNPNNYLSSVSLTSNVTGVLPVANGGTGQTTIGGLQTALGLGTYAYRSSGLAELSGATFTGDIQVGNNTSARKITINGGTAGSSYPELVFYGATSDHSWTLRGNHSTDFTIGKGVFGAYGSTLFTLTSSGNVGIGTTSPEGRIDINSSSASLIKGITLTAPFLNGSDNGQSIALRPSNSTQLYAGIDMVFENLFASYNSYLVFRTGTFASPYTERMRITSAGNVGIGTTSPSSLLHVNGTATFTGLTTVSNTGTGVLGSQFAVTNTNSNPALIAFQNTANGYAFGFSSTGTQRFIFINGAGSEIASITGAGAATFSSSVTATALGVGTTSTSYRGGIAIIRGANVAQGNLANLHVSTTDAQGANIGGSIGLGGQVGGDENVFAVLSGRKENSTSGNYAGYFAIAIPDGGASTVERFRISSTGAATFSSSVTATTVFVNRTTSFQGALQVTSNGGGVLIDTDDSNFGLTIRNTSSSNKSWDISPFGNDISINESSVASRMTFKAGGGIGIGTINPSTSASIPLTINSTGTNIGSQILFTNSYATGYVGVSADARGDITFQVDSAGSGSDKGIKFNSNGNNTRLYVASNGNIGIRTLSQFGSGVGVVAIANATTVPTTNPSDGGILYVEAGALKFRGSSGTVTTIANA